MRILCGVLHIDADYADVILLYVFKDEHDIYVCELRSLSEDASKARLNRVLRDSQAAYNNNDPTLLMCKDGFRTLYMRTIEQVPGTKALYMGEWAEEETAEEKECEVAAEEEHYRGFTQARTRGGRSMGHPSGRNH